MAQIVTDFAQLPDDNDADRLAIYAAVYAELARLGYSPPGQPYYLISHDNLVRHLQREAAKVVKQELQKTRDPDYSGKTDAEQAELLDTFHVENGAAPPVNVVFLGLPFAPNFLVTEDVTGAKANNINAATTAKG